MPPPPEDRIIRDNVDSFCRAIEKSLRLGSSKGFVCRIEFRHDIYKYICLVIVLD